MSRNVIIKALLPHRDTISTMIFTPRLSRANFTFPGRRNACGKSQNQVKTRTFNCVMSEGTGMNLRAVSAAQTISRQINVLLFGISKMYETAASHPHADPYLQACATLQRI
jgi:hypothetical protein